MINIGKLNTLEVVKEVDFGLYLDGDEKGEILLPKRYVPVNCKVGDQLEVFIYTDSEDRIIATTETPKGMVGDFVYLKVVEVNAIGAFMDWGLMKDLLVPFREQRQDMEVDKSYVVAIYFDEESERIAASAKLDGFLNDTPPDFQLGQEVDLFITNITPIGYKAIVNDTHSGVLYKNEVFSHLDKGEKVKGYIKKIRADGKIDLSMQRAGNQKVENLNDIILAKLKENDGFLALTDKSPPELIYHHFGQSKKTFKKAVGALYKQKLIVLEKGGMRLVT